MEKNVVDYLFKDTINLDLQGKTKNAIIKEMFENIKKSGLVKNEDEALKALLKREDMGSTGIGNGFALPHAKTDAVDEIMITIGISKNMIDYDSIDEEPVNVFFMFLCPINQSHEYLKILARISRIMRLEGFRKNLLKCETVEDLCNYIAEVEKIKE